jgi:hypothetical protein
VLACDPRKNALLKTGNKRDRIDARKLSELLYLNKLNPEPNVNFLKEVLTVGRVSRVLTHAVAGLRDQLDHNVAKGVQDDFQLCAKVVETHCMELPQFLATNQQSCTDFAWLLDKLWTISSAYRNQMLLHAYVNPGDSPTTRTLKGNR